VDGSAAPTLTRAELKSRWRDVETTESAPAQADFIDLCRKPGQAPPPDLLNDEILAGLIALTWSELLVRTNSASLAGHDPKRRAAFGAGRPVAVALGESMAVLHIVQAGDPCLRLPTIPVRRFDRALHRLLDDMTDSMRAVHGVGLASTQIGRSERVCIIEVDDRHIELVNPALVKVEGVQEGLEGCLSLAGYFAPLQRGAVAAATGFDRRGRPIRVSGDGLLARAIQHELDHLDGRLFIDRLESLDLLAPLADPDEDDEAQPPT
jgi:peptide deformylase